MAYQGRLHAPHRYYLVRELFRPDLEVLVADPRKNHTQEQLDRVAAQRAHYEANLNYAATRWRARIHAHCWLPDATLLFTQVRYAPLQWVMHSLRGLFAQYLRREMRIHEAHAGRYLALLVDEEEFFWDVTRYILERPATEGVCKSSLCYDYSTAAACLGRSVPPFLAESKVLTLALSMGIDTRPGLLRFLTGRPQPGFSALVERGSLSDPRILGRTGFVHRIKSEARHPQIPPQPQRSIDWVARRLGIDSSDIVRLARSPHAVEARALVAWLASCAGVAPVSEVARWFSSSDRSSLERAIAAHARNNPELFSDQALEEFHSFLLTLAEAEKQDSGAAAR